MKKICQGCKRDMNRTWFPELSDKRELYYLSSLGDVCVYSQEHQASFVLGMKNCGNNPETLKNMIENILCHYICKLICTCFDNTLQSSIRVIILGVSTILLVRQLTTVPARCLSNNHVPLSHFLILFRTHIYRFAESFCRV